MPAAKPGPELRSGGLLATFGLVAPSSRLVSLKQLLSNGPAAVVFHRGRWCPYCRISADALVQAQMKVQDEGG
jgi:peroxiredoxin